MKKQPESNRVIYETKIVIIRILGFSKIDTDNLQNKNSLDEDELIRILTTLQVNQNWLIRGFWLIAVALIGTSVAL